MLHNTNKNSDVFFNNFTSDGDGPLDLTRNSEDLLNDMYASSAVTSQAAEITAAVDLGPATTFGERPFNAFAHMTDTISDASAGFLLGSWFNRQFIIRRVLDVAKYSTLSVLIFGFVFAAVNWESYYARAVYAYQNAVGTYDLSRFNFVAHLSSEFEDYQEKSRWDKEDTAARNNLLNNARASLESTPELPQGIIPELGFAPSTPTALAVSSVSFSPLSAESRIIIPRIKVNAPISWPFDRDEHSMLDALETGVAHFPGTAMPGQYGNTFLTGHSSYYAWSPGNYKSVFVLLDKLKMEDEVILWHEGHEYTYKIYDKFVVSPDNLDVLDQAPGKKVLTLMTCTPVGTNKNRLIYRAELISS